MGKIDLVIESNYQNVDLIGACVESLSSEYFSDQQCFQIKLSVYEAVTNCIKHSYKGSSEYKVYVSYQIETDRIILDISDYGIAMDPQLLQDTPSYFDIDQENPQEGGMGLKIIKLSMDEISYHTENDMNHFTLIKYIK